MSTEVQRHYDTHLGPIYRWMIGDVDAALQQIREFFASTSLKPGAAVWELTAVRADHYEECSRGDVDFACTKAARLRLVVTW